MRILVVLLLASCMQASPGAGPGQTPDGPASRADAHDGTSQLGIYASGSRIKMRVLVTGDGAKAFLGWHDMQRAEDCSFVTASDAQVRCLPLDFSVTGGFFSDSSCSQRLAYDSRSSCATSPPPYGSVTVRSATCPTSRYSIWTVGAVYAGDVYQPDGRGGCPKLAAAPGSMWTLTAEIAPSSFQSAAEQIVD